MKAENPITIDHILLRDYFASRAPVDIPDWFEWTPSIPYPTPPDLNALNPEDRKSWMENSEWALDEDSGVSEAVREFGLKRKEWAQAAVKWDHDEITGRYFAWRWYYADQMMLARQPANGS